MYKVIFKPVIVNAKKCILLISICCFTVYGTTQTPSLPQLQQGLENAGSDTARCLSLLKLSRYYLRYTPKQDSAIYFAAECLKLSEKSRNDSFIIRSYNTLGLIFDNKSEWNLALEYYLSAIKLADEKKIYKGYARLCGNTSVIYHELKNYEASMNYLDKGQKYIHYSMDPIDQVIIYGNKSETFLGLHQTDSALKYIQLSNEVSLPLHDNYINALNICGFGEVYDQAGSNDLAAAYYKKAIGLADSSEMFIYKVDFRNYYARNLIKLKQFDSAIRLASPGLLIAKAGDYKVGALEASDILRESFDALNNRDSAYQYMVINKNLRDSIYDEERINQLQSLTFSETIREKEQEAKLEQEAEERKKNIQYAGLAIGIISFIGLYLVISNFAVHHKVIRSLGVVGLLVTFEFIGLLITPFVEKFTNHTPSLMLVSMVGIAGMLVPVHHNLEKWVNYKLIEKNKKIAQRHHKKMKAKYGGNEEKPIY